MSYFSQFPYTRYEFNNVEFVVKDILRRSAFISEWKPMTDLYEPYTIVDGDTPQSLALRFYGAATYHWVIIIFNEIHNLYYEWPMDTLNLYKYCVEKYGDDNINKIKHYSSGGIIVGEIKEFSKTGTWIPPEQVEQSVPVTFYEYEQTLNDAKRNIIIMRPELLGEFVSQHRVSIR